MHKVQKKILSISKKRDISDLSLRELGQLVDVDHPQRVKHHLNQLYKKGYLTPQKNLNILDSFKTAKQLQPNTKSIPVVGAANCGDARLYAEEKIEGHLLISPDLLTSKRNIFALKAEGDSMNKADIQGNNIEDGDYVIINYSDKQPKNNDYVLSIIDNCANIKKFVKDNENNRILLLSESTKDYPPIVISMKDNFMINGKVTQVIKQKGV
jgi:repressor LexA